MFNRLRKIYIIISSLSYLAFLVFLTNAFIKNAKFSYSPGYYMQWDMSILPKPTHQFTSLKLMAIPIVSCIIFLIVYFCKFYLFKVTGRFTTILCSVWVIINFLMLYALRYDKIYYITSNLYTAYFKSTHRVLKNYHGNSIDAIYIYIVGSALVFVGCLISLTVHNKKPIIPLSDIIEQ